MAEPRSCTKPGSVISADRVPPPSVFSASITATERPLRASSTAAARPFGPAPTTTASYAPGSVKFFFPGLTRACVLRPPSGVLAPHQAAHPAPRTRHSIEHGPGARVVPEVLNLRPLELGIDAGLLQGHRLVHAEVRGERLEDVRPDPLLLRGADDAEAQLVDPVVGACQRLDLGYRHAVLVPVSAEGVPAGLGMALGGHDREGLVVGVDHARSRVYGHAADGGAYEENLPWRNAGHRRVEPAVRRLELGKPLLPDPHRLLRRHLHAGQAHPVGLLPELPEALQRTDFAPALHVHVGGPLRYGGDLEPLYPLRPEGGVARLFFVLLPRWWGRLGHGDSPFGRKAGQPVSISAFWFWSAADARSRNIGFFSNRL